MKRRTLNLAGLALAATAAATLSPAQTQAQDALRGESENRVTAPPKPPGETIVQPGLAKAVKGEPATRILLKARAKDPENLPGGRNAKAKPTVSDTTPDDDDDEANDKGKDKGNGEDKGATQ